MICMARTIEPSSRYKHKWHINKKWQLVVVDTHSPAQSWRKNGHIAILHFIYTLEISTDW